MENTATIRRFILNHFSDEDLESLCFDYFRDVHNDFTGSMTRSRRIQLLLDHCVYSGRIPNLLAALRRMRPAPYEEHAQAQTRAT